MSTAVILGAGFSRSAGLPTQSEFFDLLLSPELSQTPLQKCITEVIEEFLGAAFGWTAGEPLPSLEEFFTCVDLSANSGHHLGIRYTPKMLRALRRMMIHRVLQILDRRYQPSPVIAEFLKTLLGKQPGFVVLNWDIVLERGLQDLAAGPINYGFDCFNWETGERTPPQGDGILVAKINGSSNWAYCDNCASMFYDLERKLALNEMVGLVKSDFRLFDEAITDKHFDEALGVTPRNRECQFCKNMISTHMATFSFAKSYRTFAYPAIWHSARRLLSEASEWVFVGYSMPDADYEFKHMLKAAQLAFGRRKAHKPAKIHLVTSKDGRSERRFRGFFGKQLVAVYHGGLEEYVRQHQGSEKSPKRKK